MMACLEAVSLAARGPLHASAPFFAGRGFPSKGHAGVQCTASCYRILAACPMQSTDVWFLSSLGGICTLNIKACKIMEITHIHSQMSDSLANKRAPFSSNFERHTNVKENGIAVFASAVRLSLQTGDFTPQPADITPQARLVLKGQQSCHSYSLTLSLPPWWQSYFIPATMVAVLPYPCHHGGSRLELRVATRKECNPRS